MLTIEQIEAIEEILRAKDIESVRLGLEIIREQGEFSTINNKESQAVVLALRDAINNDMTPDTADMGNNRHVAIELLFEVCKKCLIDPIEVLFTCINPGHGFETLPDDLDI